MIEAAEVIRAAEGLKTARATWEPHWQAIAEIIWPDLADFIDPNRVPGERRAQKVYDATAALALDRFASVLESLLTPRAQKWHRLQASVPELNEDPSVKEWFDETTRLLFSLRERPRTNFYGAAHEAYKSDGAFGTSLLFLEEEPGDARRGIEPGGFRYRSEPLGQVCVGADAHGLVDTAFKRYRLSAHAARAKWGERLPAQIRDVKDQWQEFEFLFAIFPNPDHDQTRMDAASKPWAAVDIAIEGRTILDIGGYWEFPLIVGRYTRNSAETYGRSPAMTVLPGIKTLQEMKRTQIVAGHRAVDPPILLADDDVVGAGGALKPRLLPGGLNYGGLSMRGEPLMKPFVSGMRVDITEGMMKAERDMINSAFLVDILQLLVQEPRQMTATEVMERAQEKGQLLAPLIGRQQAEKLGPQIEREINILDRQGLLPQMPPALLEAAGEYEIEYDSPATRFQRMEEIAGLSRTIEVWAPWIEADPGLLERSFKVPEGVRETATLLGVPGSWLTSDEEQAQIREREAEAQQQQAQAEQLPDQARAVKELSQAVA